MVGAILKRVRARVERLPSPGKQSTVFIVTDHFTDSRHDAQYSCTETNPGSKLGVKLRETYDLDIFTGTAMPLGGTIDVYISGLSPRLAPLSMHQTTSDCAHSLCHYIIGMYCTRRCG